MDDQLVLYMTTQGYLKLFHYGVPTAPSHSDQTGSFRQGVYVVVMVHGDHEPKTH
jgi:hypothetical protein